MIKYVTEEIENKYNMYLVDDEYNLKILIAVIHDKAHSRIMVRKMNEYVGEDKTNKSPLAKAE